MVMVGDVIWDVFLVPILFWSASQQTMLPRGSSIVVEVGLFFRLHSVDTCYVIFMAKFCCTSAECLHSCFNTNGFELGSIELFCAPSQLGKIHIILLVFILREWICMMRALES